MFKGSLTLRYGSSRAAVALTFLAILVLASVFVHFANAQGALVATVEVGRGAGALAYDSGRGEVFVAHDGSSVISVTSDSGNTVIANITSVNWPSSMVYDSAKGEVFVDDLIANNVYVISDSASPSTSSSLIALSMSLYISILLRFGLGKRNQMLGRY